MNEDDLLALFPSAAPRESVGLTTGLPLFSDLPQADYSNEGRNYPTMESTQGPGGSPINASTYSWMNQLPKGLQDVLKGLSTPAGITALAGAGLGYLDRPKPSGGGTTMAYPGAAKLERKMVQGPYGPLAEYSGVGGGTPDYTRFTAPQVQFPTAAPSPAAAPGDGMSVQSKVDQYKMLQGYGLSDDRIRRIAESIYGPQTDTDWNELKRIAGVAGGIAAVLPTASSATGTAASAPIKPATGVSAATSRAGGAATPMSQVQTAAPVAGGSEMAGPQSPQVGQDSFIAAIKAATGQPAAQTPVYIDEDSKSRMSVQRDYLGQPISFTFTDRSGRSQTVSADKTGPINELASKYGIDLKKAFGAGVSSTGGGLPWYDPKELKADASQYANVGAFAPGTPQQIVYSPEDQGLVFQPSVRGADLGTKVSEFAAKPFSEIETTLKQFKETPPKTAEELTAANSAWLEYQNRFANSQAGKEPGRYNSELKPISMLSKEYSDYGPLNEALTELSKAASAGTAQALTGSPFAGREAETLNKTVAAAGANPLVMQAINRVKEIDPNVKISTDDVGRLSGQIQELGPEYAIANFLRDKQNLVGFGTEGWQAGLNTKNPTYAAYQNLLNNIGSLYSQEPNKFAEGGHVQMEDGGFVLTKRAVDGAGGPRGIAQLVPGARPIRGPGTGTSDSIPATIQGPHGQTPAKVSNGEAYVPRRFVQAQGGPKRMYALMNQLQRKA